MIVNFSKPSNEDKLLRIKKFEPGIWTYVENPDEDDIRKLKKKYALDPNLVRDALDPFESPRLEEGEDFLYVFATTPVKTGETVTTVPVLLAIGDEALITISRRELPFLYKFKAGGVQFNTKRKTKLFTQFLKEINGLYNFHLLDIMKQVRKTSVYPGKITEMDIALFVQYEEVLNTFISDLHPIGGILRSLLKEKHLKLTDDDSDLIEDILLSNEQLIETCRLTLTNIVNIRGAYATIITNNLNRIIKLLTVLTIILTIPTIVGSFFGMNVRLPMEDNPNAFWIIIGLTFVISLIVLYLLKKKEWL
jgi:magnesium transporter